MLGSIERLPVARRLLCFDELLARQLARHDVAAIDGCAAIAGVGHGELRGGEVEPRVFDD
jgi:hypothetical protein